MTQNVRARFAPAPTGIMHLGNIRAALLNFLFAKQNGGVFILRIEDTDFQRNFDVGAHHIMNDLAWLGLHHDEGPEIKGMTYSYFQSERTDLYQEKLIELQATNHIYRCFCSSENLEKKRERQRALKQPPRYDRTCFNLSPLEVQKRLDNSTPFIWRFFVDHSKIIKLHDLAHGEISFDMSNFSDFPLTRQDGSFTFIFANFVDDWLMNITHVFRGEDHLSNSANQALLYLAFKAPIPIFWHLPIIINQEGKKLSKRDFGFSLHDLRDRGFLPEAINNYLATVGKSYPNEIMTITDLITTIDFKHIQAAGHITYDLEKLRWINHKWINRITLDDLYERSRPFIEQAYPEAKKIDTTLLKNLLSQLKTDFVTLEDTIPALLFYFQKPEISCETFNRDDIFPIIEAIFQNKMILKQGDSVAFLQVIKDATQATKIPIAKTFSFIRYLLTGSIKGPSVTILINLLGSEESLNRIEAGLQKFE